MNAADERSRSCWIDIDPIASDGPLRGGTHCDMLVVGAGIAGLSIAYELTRIGRTVAVINNYRTTERTRHGDEEQASIRCQKNSREIGCPAGHRSL